MQRLFSFDAAADTITERPIGDVAVCRDDGDWCWLDLAAPTEAELAAAAETFGLRDLQRRGLPDLAPYPKVVTHTEHLHVVLHTVTTRDQHLSTVALHLFIGVDFIVSVRMAAAIDAEWLAETVTAASAFSDLSPGMLGAILAEAAGRRFLPLLDVLDERIQVLEELAIAADPRTLAENQALRRDVILLRRTAGPQREVLRHLGQSGGEYIDQQAALAFSDVYDLLFRIVESLDSARALLGSVLETYRGAIAERTNEVMKILTVYSAILLPLTLIAGLWGMNFEHIPASAWRWGFVGLVGVMAAVAASLWWYFTSRGFIGGPRLHQLPKVVGLGLVHIGTAPIRALIGSGKAEEPAGDTSPAEGTDSS